MDRGPLTDGENRGALQEMASVRAKVSSFWARMQGWAGAPQAFPTEASPERTLPSLGQPSPTPESSGQDHRVPVTVSMELDTFPAVQRTMRFPGDHTSQQVSHPRKGRVPREEPGTWGPEGVLATVPRQVERVRAGRTHAHRRVLPWGVRPALCMSG